LHYLDIEIKSADPTLDGVLASVCTQIELSFAIISASIPVLRPFMSALNTNYGAPAQNKSVYHTGGSQSGNDYSLASFSHKSAFNRSREGKGEPDTKTRWDIAGHHASVMSGDQHSMESHESRQMIIAKDTQWTVEYTANGGAENKETAPK
jgi:hypothetical protein